MSEEQYDWLRVGGAIVEAFDGVDRPPTERWPEGKRDSLWLMASELAELNDKIAYLVQRRRTVELFIAHYTNPVPPVIEAAPALVARRNGTGAM
jgi:hypothetical protein